jgi:hypothetical protein
MFAAIGTNSNTLFINENKFTHDAINTHGFLLFGATKSTYRHNK